MKKKIVIISLLVVILVAITITVKLSFSKIDKVTEDAKENAETMKDNENNDETNNPNKDVEKAKEKIYVADEELDRILFRTKEDLYNFKFQEINEAIHESLDGMLFNDSKKHNDFKRIYAEMSLMASFLDLKEREQYDLIYDIIKDFKNPDTFFTSIMWLSSANRKHFIMTSDSINPGFEGGLNILEKKEVKLEDMDNLSNLTSRIKDIEKIYEYTFGIREDKLIAYIVESKDKLQLYKITEKVKGSTNYLTIEEWDNVLMELRSNLKSKDKDSNLEEESVHEVDEDGEEGEAIPLEEIKEVEEGDGLSD